MKSITKDLGVKCNYCHDMKDKSKDTQMKETARDFMSLVDYINNIDNQHFITEAGDMETWEGGFDKKYLKKSFDKQINEFEKNWKKSENINNK